jgi:hypothetical protein
MPGQGCEIHHDHLQDPYKLAILIILPPRLMLYNLCSVSSIII